MQRVEALLRLYNAEFIYKKGEFVLTDYGEPWGKIYVLEDFVYFEHGNCEFKLDINSGKLGEAIDKYLLGFDEFEEWIQAQ